MKKAELAGRLYRARKMKTAEEVIAFEEARLQIFSLKDPVMLKYLFLAFDDSTEQHEVMWGLVHDAEAFERRVYLKELAMTTPQMFPHAREWSRLLHRRVLKNGSATALYRDVLQSLSCEVRTFVEELIKRAVADDPDMKISARRIVR